MANLVSFTVPLALSRLAGKKSSQPMFRPVSQIPSPSDPLTAPPQGYFQLKANPGVLSLSLREGASNEIYKIIKVDGKLIRGSCEFLIFSVETDLRPFYTLLYHQERGS